MYLTPFVSIFREQGLKETRVITIRHYPGLPDDDYALIEAYCTDPECDCRRVMLNVVSQRLPGTQLASISFGFDRHDEMAGPFLDPLNPRSHFADALLALVADILNDPAYVARLESHYHQFKRAITDPKDPGYETMRRIRADEKRWEASEDRKPVARLATGSRKRRKKKR